MKDQNPHKTIFWTKVNNALMMFLLLQNYWLVWTRVKPSFLNSVVPRTVGFSIIAKFFPNRVKLLIFRNCVIDVWMNDVEEKHLKNLLKSWKSCAMHFSFSFFCLQKEKRFMTNKLSPPFQLTWERKTNNALKETKMSNETNFPMSNDMEKIWH